MASALFFGILGSGLTLLLGWGVLDFTILDCLLCILATALAGWVAVFSTMRLEQVRWIKKYVLSGSGTTYLYFLTVYFGLMFLIAPKLAHVYPLLVLIAPLIMITGFSIIAYGPVQDLFVRRQQRKRLAGGKPSG